ncbi:RebB family R body protein [Pseudoalteromonas denitrificans]|uniref:Killing trait domain-containing protein n=1 Tax=Pseudoalteromonas denitrificans DSM 6059 TaxID=1123010 RepID=A0A1I1T8Z8_9GAMM|nr:RebB family R body protein [Pseudoalteromonas denitrificans]SFD51900.1 Killing trait domain-containing protein [Pseudoalteromonas denitrificans DSM 6059]
MSNQSPEQLCNDLVSQYAPGISRSMLIQATAQALGNAAHNASFAQQQQNIIINSNTALSTSIIHAIGAAYAKK